MRTFTLLRKLLLPILVLALIGAQQANAVFAQADNWKSLGLDGAYIRSLVIDPQNPSILYAGTPYNVYKSTNAGLTWAVLPETQGTSDIWSMAIDPKTPSTLYAVRDGPGVIKSVNGGQNWTTINNGMNTLARSIVINPQDTTNLYVGTWEGVFKSINGGKTWVSINKGLIYGTDINYSMVNKVAIDPQSPDILYAGTYDGGVFRSINAGEDWLPFNGGLDNLWIHALAVDPKSPSTLYAGTKGGVFRSDDRAGHWEDANAGLPADRNVLSLAIDPQTPTTVYTGLRDGGVFKSVDSGKNWVSVGMIGTIPYALAMDSAAHPTLYAGTSGKGVFVLDNSLKFYLPVIRK